MLSRRWFPQISHILDLTQRARARQNDRISKSILILNCSRLTAMLLDYPYYLKIFVPQSIYMFSTWMGLSLAPFWRNPCRRGLLARRVSSQWSLKNHHHCQVSSLCHWSCSVGRFVTFQFFIGFFSEHWRKLWNKKIKCKRHRCLRWSKYYSRWWFQRFFIFIPTWGNDPIWLIFFKGLKPPTRFIVKGFYILHLEDWWESIR